MTDTTYRKLRKLSPKVTGGLIRMREATFFDGSVSVKYKILTALSIVVATKCEPCIIGYTKMAHQAGASVDELVEFLNGAITEAGCPAEQWAMKALETYNNLERGETVELEICCHE
jgi:AhpD family alkylhydroperoxidase